MGGFFNKYVLSYRGNQARVAQFKRFDDLLAFHFVTHSTRSALSIAL